MASSSEKGKSVVSDTNKLEADLSFKLDGMQAKEIETFEVELFPSTRSRLIEIIEDKPDYIEFGSSIHCQSLQWEFKCPLKWSKLKKTKFDDVRFCTLCEERVYTAYSKAELKRLTSQGSCVRVITEKQLHAVGFMSPGLYESESSPVESIALIDAILQLDKNIEQFKKRRGFYPAIKLTRLLGRLDRFQMQVDLKLREKETGLSKEFITLPLDQQTETEDKFKAVKKLINNRVQIEKKLQEANEYIAFKSDRS